MRISDWSADVCSSDLLIRRDQVDQVNVALPWTADARLRDIVGRLQRTPVTVRLAPDVAVFSFPDRRLVTVGRRSDERRVGTECASTFSSRWAPSHYKTKIK